MPILDMSQATEVLDIFLGSQYSEVSESPDTVNKESELNGENRNNATQLSDNIDNIINSPEIRSSLEEGMKNAQPDGEEERKKSFEEKYGKKQKTDDTKTQNGADETEIISQKDVPGFRLDFEARYRELRDLALQNTGLQTEDLPILERDYKVNKIEAKASSNEYQTLMKIKELEAMLSKLTDFYHEIGENGLGYENLEAIRERIHDCKRKIFILKNQMNINKKKEEENNKENNTDDLTNL